MKKHILVISQYFYPEQFRINDICEEWIKRGYEVTVITGIPNYPKGKFYKGYNLFKKRNEFYNGIKIVRIPIVPRGNNPIQLSLNYLSFVISGFFWNLLARIKADLVFIFEVSPMTQALPGVWYAKKRNIPCYLYVQDLWPENVEILTGLKNRFIINQIGRMVNYIYSKSTLIFTTSMSFIHSINKRGVPLEKLEYWPQFAEDLYAPLNRVEVEEFDVNAFNVTFTGNIGYSQGLEILIEAAQLLRLKSKKKIIFNLIGDGRYKEILEAEVIDKGLADSINFVNQQPANKIPELLAASDVALLSFNDSPLFQMTIPAKLQSYLACGVPIVATASGESVRIIKEANCGLYGDPGDAISLAENIIILMNMTANERLKLGENALKYYQKHFNKMKLMDKMDYFISNI